MLILLCDQREPSAVSLLRISRARDGTLEVTGSAWQEDGRLSARYWSEAVKERKESAGVFYYWKGERPLDPNAPQLDGTGEIRLGDGMKLAGVGIIIGVAVAFVLSKVMSSLLFGVGGMDAMTFATVSIGALAVALLACYIPARRATKVDPLVALRNE